MLTAQERARAAAAIERLRAQANVDGRYRAVIRRPAQEDGTFYVSVHVHDGPLGNGRTIIVEKQVGSILHRRMAGDEAYGNTRDWQEIDLSGIV
jgi:hypothetical protein